MWVYIHTCSNVICSTIIKMLTAYSTNLISCHLLSNILAGYIMCSHLLYQQCSEQDHLRTSQRTFRTSRRTFPSQLPMEFGWSAARINVSCAYLFLLCLLAWFVINKFGTLWHCYYYSLLSSYMCSFHLGIHMIYCLVYSFKIGHDIK